MKLVHNVIMLDHANGEWELSTLTNPKDGRHAANWRRAVRAFYDCDTKVLIDLTGSHYKSLDGERTCITLCTETPLIASRDGDWIHLEHEHGIHDFSLVGPLLCA